MKQYKVSGPRRRGDAAGTQWGVLLSSAVLMGLVVGTVVVGIAPSIPWDTRGVSFTKVGMDAR